MGMETVVLAVMIFILATFAVVWSGATWSSAKPSLSRKVKQHLHELYCEFNTMLPETTFFHLALILWNICGIKPLRLRRTSNFAEDFDLESLDRVEFVKRVGRSFDVVLTTAMAERIYTFYDLVKFLEADYLENHDLE